MIKQTINLIERYPDSLEACEDLSSQTLKRLKELDLRSNPVHFLLLFEAISKRDPSLARKIQQTIELNTYNDEVANDIMQTLLLEWIDLPHLPTEEVSDLIRNLLSHMKNWLSRSDIALNQLDAFVESDNLFTSDALNQIQNEIMPVLRQQFDDTQKLHLTLEHTQEEVDTLRKQLEKERSLSVTDDLTGIPNRRGFNRISKEFVEKAQTSGTTFAMVLIDIDYFKKINDNYGHLLGDSILRFLAKFVEKEIKGKDFFARFGGEEFVILLPNTSYDHAITVANKLREKLAAKKLNIAQKSKTLRITISAGVGMYQMGEPIENLLDRTDQALYKAKNTGRNKVVGEASL